MAKEKEKPKTELGPQLSGGNTHPKLQAEAPEYLLQFFEYGHLPAHMQDTSRMFHELAHAMVASLPRNPERTMALRRLLEAKDCAVRAVIFK